MLEFPQYLLHQSDLEGALRFGGESHGLGGWGFSDEVTPQNVTSLAGDVVTSHLVGDLWNTKIQKFSSLVSILHLLDNVGRLDLKCRSLFRL